MCDRSQLALEARARRVAKRKGYAARKSRCRPGTVDNFRNFQLVDPFHNWIVAGSRFDLTPEEIIELLEPNSTQ